MPLDVAIPHDMPVRVAILVAALGLDALVGDPPWLWGRIPHPVEMFGRAITGVEKLLNRPRLAGFRLTGKVRRGLGIFAILFLVSVAVVIGGAITSTASAGGMPLTISVELLLVATLLAGRSLADHARSVATALENGTIREARVAVSKIVGRNPEGLERSAIIRATIESTAENLSDGIIAPALYYIVFGIPGIFAYKMISTADSMIGYRTARHLAFGWGAARLDDLVNFFPARLAGSLIALTIPSKACHAFFVMRRDAPNQPSPNAGWPEAAMAAQLDLSLAGPRLYGHRTSEVHKLNQSALRSTLPADISRAIVLMRYTVALFILLIGIIALVKLQILSCL